MKHYYDNYEMMNPEDSNNNNEKNLSKKLFDHKIFFITIACVFIIEVFLRWPLFNLSIPTIHFLQKYLYYFRPFANLFSFLATENGIVFIIVISYNFLNTFETLLLLISSLFSAYVCGVMKLIYIQPRPYMVSPNEITPLGCEGGWGNPSGHSILSTCFFLTLYKVISNSSQKNKDNNENIINDNYNDSTKIDWTFCGIIGLIFLVCFSRLFLGVHSLNQIIYGIFIGFSIYYFIFFVLELDPKEPSTLLTIALKFKTVLCTVMFLFILGWIPYLTISPNQNSKDNWNKIINEKCSAIPKAKRFEYESFLGIWGFTSLIPIIVGIYIEFYVIFNCDVAKWSRYNFDPYSCKERNLLPNDFINEDNENTRWNNTEMDKSIKRLVVILLVLLFLMIPHFLVKYTQNFTLVISIKILLPIYLIMFLMFSYLKLFLSFIGLTNMNLFNDYDNYCKNPLLDNNQDIESQEYGDEIICTDRPPKIEMDQIK